MTSLAPDDLEQAVGDDEHLPGDLALAADEVARCEDEGFHLEHEVVQKLGLAFLKDRHLKPNISGFPAEQFSATRLTNPWQLLTCHEEDYNNDADKLQL